MGSSAAGFPHDLYITESFARFYCFDKMHKGLYACSFIYVSIYLFIYFAPPINGSGLVAPTEGKNNVIKTICYFPLLHSICLQHTPPPPPHFVPFPSTALAAGHSVYPACLNK